MVLVFTGVHVSVCMCVEMTGEKVVVDIGSATVIDLVALTTEALGVTMTAVDIGTMIAIVIAVVVMTSTEVATTAIEVMLLRCLLQTYLCVSVCAIHTP